MRDISTEDLIRTLCVKTTALERARCVAALHPTGQLCGAVKARERDFHNAMRALKTHLQEIERVIKRGQQVKLPPGYLIRSTKLSGRTIGALRRWKVLQPETLTLEELLRIPEIGIQAVANIAARAYNSASHPVNWPELKGDD